MPPASEGRVDIGCGITGPNISVNATFDGVSACVCVRVCCMVMFQQMQSGSSGFQCGWICMRTRKVILCVVHTAAERICSKQYNCHARVHAVRDCAIRPYALTCSSGVTLPWPRNSNTLCSANAAAMSDAASPSRRACRSPTPRTSAPIADIKRTSCSMCALQSGGLMRPRTCKLQ